MKDRLIENQRSGPTLFADFESGVLWFNSEPVFYRLNAAGSWEARIIGSPDLLPMTSELLGAISTDIAHQKSKQ